MGAITVGTPINPFRAYKEGQGSPSQHPHTDPRLSLRHPITRAISYDSQYKPTDHRSRLLHRANGPKLSNSCVSVAFLFLITCTSADESTFLRYPSEDCRRYSVDIEAFMQNFVKLAPLIKPCMILGVILFLVYDG